MDRRAPPGATTIRRPSATLQRAASGGSYGFAHQIPKRPTALANTTSGLSNVRSVSQPVELEDLSERVERARENVAAYRENLGMMVRSPEALSTPEEDEAEEEEDAIQPPAKRLKTEREDLEEEDVDMDDQEPSLADHIMPGRPLPGLTMLNCGMMQGYTRKQRQCYTVDPASRKPHGPEPPALATKAPPPKKVLDYSPWSGTHPEDVLTETVIKNGYSDNPKTNQQNECNSAKATLWPQLSTRNHTGLQMLAYLYTQVMEKRQAMGRCTAPSTFKPPPRVTVTDTKREAWLRDLANPDVPLRKQSRTIPHGIRGKLLMEQCLGKSIPLQRAVWLAKCVGANELRAFRRKGVSGPAAASGETKWVREWTIQVEQFLDSVIALCGQSGWKEKMNYAVKLATAFFAEKLLDLEHYLDWIVSSLKAAGLDQVPIWIVLAQLYWQPLTSYGKRGKAFAEALLEHLQRVHESRLEINVPLKLRLSKLIAVLAVSHRGCLVEPPVWAKYRALLAVPPNADSTLVLAMEDVARRNARIAAPSDDPDAKERSPLNKLYRLLDQVGVDVDIEKLATTGRSLVPDCTTLVTALLEWASTLYRTGSSRIYLAARLIAHLKANAVDTDSIILQYLGGAGNVTPRSKHNLYMVTVELVRLESFSIGRYLQWLITSGAGSYGDMESASSGLLAALPANGLPVHLLNTRASLLRRLGFTVDETAQVDVASGAISIAMNAGTTDDARATLPETLSLSSRLSIVDAVNEKVGMMVKAGSLTLSAFNTAREVIERVGDLSRLADVVQTACISDMTPLLATICDTVTYHASSFAALGCLPVLIDSISEQYMLVRSQQSLDRTLIVALSTLTERTSKKTSFLKLLNDDLAICDQQSSLAVCSPASDSVVGMQATTLDSENDIDAVFASGNTMDEQLMQRVFVRIMQYTTKSHDASTEAVSKVCNWLSQLRLVDGGGAFERIVRDWLQSVLKASNASDLPVCAIESLIVTGSVSVHTVADTTKEATSPAVAAAVLRTLLSSSASNTELSDSERYRHSLHKEETMADHASSLGGLLRYAAESSDLDTNDPALVQFCIRCSSANPGMLRALFDGNDLSGPVKINVGLLVKALLQVDARRVESSNELDFDVLVNMAGPLSATFCVEALRWMRSNANWTPEDDEKFKNALLESFKADSGAWPQMLEVAGEKVNSSVHEWACENVLRFADGESENDGYLHRCLKLLTATGPATSKIDSTVHVNLLSAKLKGLEKNISTLTASSEATSSVANAKKRLPLYLRLSIMHIHNLQDESESSKLARVNLLSTLCALLVCTPLQIHADTIEYIADIASTLADNILDDTQHTAQKIYSSGKLPSSDARLAFILGANPSAAGTTGLALAHPVATASAGQGSAQQRLLSRQGLGHFPPSQQAQQQGQINRTPTSSQQQQTMPFQQHQRFPSQGNTSGGPMPPGAGAGFGPGHRGQTQVEIKLLPFQLRRWEILSDPTPVMGENDGSLSLGLFAARKV